MLAINKDAKVFLEPELGAGLLAQLKANWYKDPKCCAQKTKIVKHNLQQDSLKFTGFKSCTIFYIGGIKRTKKKSINNASLQKCCIGIVAKRLDWSGPSAQLIATRKASIFGI